MYLVRIGRELAGRKKGTGVGAIPKGKEQVLERRSSKWRMCQVTVGEALRNPVG